MPLFHAPPLAMNALLRLHLHHALKTGLATALTFALSALMNSPYSTWGVISALVVMQGTSVTDSILESLSRFTSMTVGALIGMVLLIVTPPDPLYLGPEVFAICTLGAYLRRYGQRFSLGTIAICIVLLAGQMVAGSGDVMDSVRFGLFLSLETLLGVFCAVLVSAFLWPVRLGDILRRDISNQFERVSSMLDTVVNSYLDEQTHVSDAKFNALHMETWSNRERMAKVKRLEAHIYHFEHEGLAIQVETVERFVEGMRALIDALNEYDEESVDPLLGPELRHLADQLRLALAHLGGDDAYAPAPEVVRSLTRAVDLAEERIIELRAKGSYRTIPLHRILQLYSFYQVLRQLSEELLHALYKMEKLGNEPLVKKNAPAR